MAGYDGTIKGTPNLRRSKAAANSDEGTSRVLNVGGLFAGIGGIELGLTSAGHLTRMLCEIDVGATAVLQSHFPDVSITADIRRLRTIPREIDCLTAGFPCQDLSQAGTTAGLKGRSSGLVGEVFRLLEVRRRSRSRVPWVVLENVPFMLQLARGAALEVIVDKLEALGYRWAYRVVDSLAFGVPQRRERVFLVACVEDDPRSVLLADDIGDPLTEGADPDLGYGFYWTEGTRGLGTAVDSVPTLKGGSTVGIPSPPAIVLPSGDVVTPGIEDAERMQGFPAGWTQSAERVVRRGHRWKLVGNAVTVDVAKWIGRRLATPGHYEPIWDTPLRRTGAWPRAAWNVGSGRFISAVSSGPVRVDRPRITTFLEKPRMLSARATAGFMSRLERSRLTRPPWFDERVRAHLARMRAAEAQSHFANEPKASRQEAEQAGPAY